MRGLSWAALLAACGACVACGHPPANQQTTSPTVSDFPVLSVSFTSPRVGVKRKYTLEQQERIDQSKSSDNKSNSSYQTILKSDTSNTSSTTNAESASGKIGYTNAINVDFSGSASSASNDSFTSTFSTSNESLFKQESSTEERDLVENITNNRSVIDDSSGFIDATMVLRNDSAFDVTISNVRVQLRYVPDEGGDSETFVSGTVVGNGNLRVEDAGSTATPESSKAKITIAGLPADNTARQAVNLVGRSTDAVLSLLDADSVAFSVEDMDVSWSGKSMNYTEYRHLLADKMRQAVLVHVEGISGERSYLVDPPGNGAAMTRLDALRVSLGHRVTVAQGDKVAILDRQAQPRAPLAAPDRLAGSWILLLNGKPASLTLLNGNVEHGDVIDVVFLRAELMANRSFDRSTSLVSLSLASQFMWSVRTTSEAEGSAPGTADIHVDKTVARTDSNRICLSDTVDVGDVVALEIRYSQTPDLTEQRSATGLYPPKGANPVLLEKSCRAKEYVPANQLQMSSGRQAIDDNGTFVAFGLDSPAFQLNKLINRIPRRQARSLDDGTVQVLLPVTKAWLSKPRPVCVGLANIQGKGTLGRSINPLHLDGQGGYVAITNKLIETRCNAWFKESPQVGSESFLRNAEANITVQIFRARSKATSDTGHVLD